MKLLLINTYLSFWKWIWRISGGKTTCNESWVYLNRVVQFFFKKKNLLQFKIESKLTIQIGKKLLVYWQWVMSLAYQ